jgi:hypothetical protein
LKKSSTNWKYPQFPMIKKAQGLNILARWALPCEVRFSQRFQIMVKSGHCDVGILHHCMVSWSRRPWHKGYHTITESSTCVISVSSYSWQANSIWMLKSNPTICH